MEQKRPIVVAGNGPSLAQIDYRRLPKEFDTYRVNTFFLEESYYLGKDVTFLSFESHTCNLFYPVYQKIRKDHDYIIHHADVGYGFFPGCPNDISNHSKEAYLNHPIWYPHLERNNIDIFHPLIREYYINCFRYTGMLPSTGMCNILRAVSYGYTDIYITGIDFFEEHKYAFGTENRPGSHKQPDYVIQCEKDTLSFVLENFPEVSFYCISEIGKLKDILPLAPICNDNPYVPINKPQFYAKEYTPKKIYTKFRFTIELEEQQKELKQQEELKQQATHKGFIQKIKALFIKKGMEVEWNALRENIYLRLIYHAIKPIWVLAKFIFRKGDHV
ncbi:MAG: alpha-2,3-sialyltransferase [Brevinema sp.]